MVTNLCRHSGEVLPPSLHWAELFTITVPAGGIGSIPTCTMRDASGGVRKDRSLLNSTCLTRFAVREWRCRCSSGVANVVDMNNGLAGHWC
eukprot:912610-Amphidinium_carterae.1